MTFSFCFKFYENFCAGQNKQYVNISLCNGVTPKTLPKAMTTVVNDAYLCVV